jgi:hypothetical protein
MNRILGVFALMACIASTDGALARGQRAGGVASGVSFAIAISPDGKYVAVPGQDGILRLWEIGAKKDARTLPGTGVSAWSVAFSPDAKCVAASLADNTVRIWDVATGKETHQLKGHGSTVWFVTFTPDGKSLASGGEDLTIRLWDLTSGKEVTRIGDNPAGVWPLAFSPDGKTLAAGYSNGALILWDTASGKKVRQLSTRASGVWPLVYSPDGRTLAAGAYNATDVYLLDVGTGRVRHLQLAQNLGWSLAFSPDGRTLLSGGGDRIIHSWEVATGRERARYVGHQNPVYAIALGMAGRMAASIDSQGSIMTWDVPGLPKLVNLAARDLDSLWGDLKDSDAEKAYRAIWTLTTGPKLAIPYLRERLQPKKVAAPDAREIDRLIADLDHDRFLTRRNATIALEKLGKLAEKALRKAAPKARTPEMRMRIELLLSKLDAEGLTADQVQAFRALEVLELLGTAEARKALEELAKQDTDDWLRNEAKASRVRIGRRGS